jgi:S-DNA-T family DNA segregation ATPase FtsK/SpoIIIE
MRERRLNEVKGVILVAIGLILLASLISFSAFDLRFYTSHPNIPPRNLIGTFGAYLAGILLFLFGWSVYLIPLFILWIGIRLFRQHIPYLSLPRIFGIAFLLLSTASLIGMLTMKNNAIAFSHAGFFGSLISNFVAPRLGSLGAYITFIALIILSIALVSEILISTLFLNIIARIKSITKPGFGFFARKREVKVKLPSVEKKEAKPQVSLK